MTTEKTAATAESSVIALDGNGSLRFLTGEARPLWTAHAGEIRELAARAREQGAIEEGHLSSGEGEWQATAWPGATANGSPLVVVRLQRVSSDVWARPGILDGEKYQALCRLVAGMVHELRNPLSGISLTAELIGLRSDVPAEVKGKLADIVHQVDRASEVLQSLRRFSREEHPAMRLLSLNDLAHDAVRLEASGLAAKSIDLALELDPELPTVLADPSQLRLAIANLIRNAGEAMAGCARGDGRRGRIEVRTSHRHGVVRLVVEDEGPGVPAELLAKVFDPYFTTKEHGTGLGLPMSYGIAKAHGGHLWVESRRPQGARFLIDLPDPQHSTPGWHRSALGIDLSEGPTYSALVVDASEDRLERLREMIATQGWKVHVAAGAGVALKKLRAADFDAVLVAGDAPEEVVDFCARARLAQPSVSGHIAVLVPAEPAPETLAKLRLTGARVVCGPHESAAIQGLVRLLAEGGRDRRGAHAR